MLLTYQSKYGLKTMKAIISRWAPPAENDIVAYVRAVEASTGTRPGADVDLSQPAVMTGFVKAIIHHENAGYAYPDGVVRRRVAGAGMTPGQILVAILLAVAIGFGGACQVQDWRMGKQLAEQLSERGIAHQKALDSITTDSRAG